MLREIHTRLGTKRIKMVDSKFGEIPETIYKYRDWKNEYHRQILLHQEIFVPSSRSFNDPFDCRIPIAFHLFKDDEELAKNYFFTQVVNNPNHSIEERNIEVQRLINEGRYKEDDFLENLHEDFFDSFQNTLGVFCVTAVNDNTLMWAHYANNHQGFCIGFDSIELFEQFGMGKEVSYEESFPLILPTEKPLMKMAIQAFTKASYWDYEIEYRLTKSNFVDKTIILSKEVIKEIILGYKISEFDKKNILKILKLELPHVKVYITKPKKQSFELDLVPIN